MANEPRIIADFPICRECGSSEKVSEKAVAHLKESGKVDKDSFTRLRVDATLIEQPIMAGVMVDTIITHWDVCAECGKERVTRVEIIKVPGQGIPMPKGGTRPPFIGKG